MWILTRPDGQIFYFYIKSCAELYKNIWDGALSYSEHIHTTDIAAV